MASVASVTTPYCEDHHIEPPLGDNIQKPSEHRPFLGGVSVPGLSLLPVDRTRLPAPVETYLVEQPLLD